MSTVALVAVGCSAGGIDALSILLADYAPARAIPMVVVCHTASDDLDGLCRLLQRHSRLPVTAAEERALPRAGQVHIAPAGYHLYLERDGHFGLSVDARVSFARPSIDVFFRSVADALGPGACGVLLTGANADGAEGLAEIRAVGGHTLVQDPADAAVPDMPRAALVRDPAHPVLPLAAMAAHLHHRIDEPSHA